MVEAPAVRPPATAPAAPATDGANLSAPPAPAPPPPTSSSADTAAALPTESEKRDEGAAPAS
jgi:hypothetical protein